MALAAQVSVVEVVIADDGLMLAVVIVGTVLTTVAALEVLEDPAVVPSDGVTAQVIVVPTDKFDTTNELPDPRLLPLLSVQLYDNDTESPSTSEPLAEHVIVSPISTWDADNVGPLETVGAEFWTATLAFPVALCPSESVTVAVQTTWSPTLVSLAETV